MRRIGLGLVTMAAVVLTAAGLIVFGRDPSPAPAALDWPTRRPEQRTLVLGPGSGFRTVQFMTDPSRQQLSVTDDQGTADVWAYNPGSFDLRVVAGGQGVLLAGHDATYVRAPVPLLAWHNAADAWITVSGTVDRAALFRLARAVRLDPPTPVAGPVGLSRLLPGGLVLNDARIGNGTASMTLLARGRRTYDVRLSIYPVLGNDWTNGTLGLGTPTTVVAGHPAWYSESGPDDSQLLLEAGTCGLRVQVSDRNRVPPAALDTILRGASFGSCDTAADWPPILS